PASLLSIEVVHSRVGPHAERKREVDPWFRRRDQVGDLDGEKGYIGDDKGEADERDGVGCEPAGEELGAKLPLNWRGLLVSVLRLVMAGQVVKSRAAEEDSHNA